MIIAFTGHRPNKFGTDGEYATSIYSAVLDVLNELKPEKVISGMARGVDTIAAICAHSVGIPYIAAIPFLSHATNHAVEDQKIYDDLLKNALDIQITSDGDYAIWKFQKRNEWMVDNCDLLCAVWNGSRGGTANCIKYAKQVGREIKYLQWGGSCNSDELPKL